jgi:type II secretory pathway pseudopilin PulG
MAIKKNFLNNKKSAFTYLELIISMSIIVLVTILTTPFLVVLSTPKISPAGGYVCYAKYEGGVWKLYENLRLNTTNFSSQDKQVETCNFNKPAGNVGSYIITVYGAGGSGSAPYFHERKLFIAPGDDGIQGEIKTVVAKSIPDKLSIGICNGGNEAQTCIGKGGEKNIEYDTSYIKWERIQTIINNIEKRIFAKNDFAYIKNNLENYNNQCGRDEEDYNKENIPSECTGFLDNMKNLERDLNSGHSGGYTQFMLSSGELIIANGGRGGISDPNHSTTYSMTTGNMQKSNKGENIYYFPKDIEPNIVSNIYQDCDGQNADTDINNFGNPGKAGGIICQIETEDYNSIELPQEAEKNTPLKVEKNTCYSCNGGMGAGGAIMIEWK